MSTTISGTSGVTFPDSTSMQTGQQACKAWVNFNGTGTVAIRGSYNVSSITDNGTGQYTVNFTTAMPDTNFGCCFTAGSAGSYGTNAYEGQVGVSPVRTTSSVQLETTSNSTVAIVDDPTINVTIFSN